MTGFNPLPTVEDEEVGDVQWAGISKILGPRWLQLPALTIGLVGVQVCWSVEMSYASPYLIELGLSKSLTAIAFLAGPLSGLIVQPLIGAIADNSKSRFGRRRPYMMLATVICSLAILLLGFTRDFVSLFMTRGSSANNTLTIIFAVFALFGIDFSVNAVQAVDRALIVDTLSYSLQPAGNAWAARMLGIGSVAGFFAGNLDLTRSISFLGHTQLEVLAAISACLLLFAQSTTAACVKEKVLVSSSQQRKGLVQEIKEIWENILILPRIIRQICIIQFLAWMAWFPVLFYTSVYVGDLYKKTQPIPEDEDALEVLNTEATILGSRAMFYLGVVALFANFVMPLFVIPDTKEEETNKAVSTSVFNDSILLERIKVFHLCELWAFSHLLFALCMVATFFISTVSGAMVLISVIGFSWAMTQWAPFSLLAEAIISSSQEMAFDDGASIRLLRAHIDDRESVRRPYEGEVDVVWDSSETNERRRLIENSNRRSESDHGERTKRKDSISDTEVISEPHVFSLDGSRPAPPFANIEARRSRSDLNAHSSSHSNGNIYVHSIPNSEAEAASDVNDELDTFDTDPGPTSPLQAKPRGLQSKSGIIIGIHNLFIVIPQFISSGLTSLVFAIFDPSKSVVHDREPGVRLPGNGTRLAVPGNNTILSTLFSTEGTDDKPDPTVNSVAVIFRLGGIAALFAFALCWRLARELKKAR